MFRLVPALLLALALTAPARAATFLLGEPPVVEITVPDSWGPAETRRGVDATSPDGLMYMFAEIHPATPDAIDAAVTEAFDWASDNGMRFMGRPTPPETQPFNGWPRAVSTMWSGVDQDGNDSLVSVTVVPLDARAALVIHAWGSNGGEQVHVETQRRIAGSLRPAPRR